MRFSSESVYRNFPSVALVASIFSIAKLSQPTQKKLYETRDEAPDGKIKGIFCFSIRSSRIHFQFRVCNRLMWREEDCATVFSRRIACCSQLIRIEIEITCFPKKENIYFDFLYPHRNFQRRTLTGLYFTTDSESDGEMFTYLRRWVEIHVSARGRTFARKQLVR